MNEPLITAPAAGPGVAIGQAFQALDTRPGLGAFLGDMAASSFQDSTLAGRATLAARIRRAEIDAADADLAKLTPEDYAVSEFAREGLPYQANLTIAAARARAEIFDERKAREARLAARDPGFTDMALGFGAGVLGALPTPENFIPFAGPALAAARSAREGSRLYRLALTAEAARTGGVAARAAFGAGTGAIDALLGQALAAPLIYADRARFGDDVGWAEIVQDLALGIAGGAVLGGTFGAVLGRRNPAATLANDPALKPLSPAEQDNALRALNAAAAQLADGGEIDLLQMPPAIRGQVEALIRENQIFRAAQQATADEGAGKSARAAARPIGATEPAAPGVTNRATTPAGLEVQSRFEVVEASDLTVSHSPDTFNENPNFPQQLQPRDRTQLERQGQVRDIAVVLRPEEVEASPLTSTGAPIVGPDGVVESGNGRTMAVMLAYQEGLPTAQTYRAYLVQAGFEDAAAMKAPVLIRRRTTDLSPEQRLTLVQDSNVTTVDKLTPTEQARTDAQRLTPEMLRLLRSNDLMTEANADFIRALVQSLTGAESRSLSAGGTLTADGVRRLERALMARAYGDTPLLDRLINSKDDAEAGMGRGLMAAAPALARLRGAIEAGEIAADLNGLPALVRAAQRIADARASNKPLGAIMDQVDAFDPITPIERAWLSLLLRQPIRTELGRVGAETTADRLNGFARLAEDAPRDPDMFGTPPPGLGDIMAAALRQAGLESDPALRGLTADSYAPRAEALQTPPPEPPAAAPAADQAAPGASLATRAAQMGLDIADDGTLQRANALLESRAFPPELRAALDEAQALQDQTARMADAYDAAATCAIRG
jgi:hypothetical protein